MKLHYDVDFGPYREIEGRALAKVRLQLDSKDRAVFHGHEIPRVAFHPTDDEINKIVWSGVPVTIPFESLHAADAQLQRAAEVLESHRLAAEQTWKGASKHSRMTGEKIKKLFAVKQRTPHKNTITIRAR